MAENNASKVETSKLLCTVLADNSFSWHLGPDHGLIPSIVSQKFVQGYLKPWNICGQFIDMNVIIVYHFRFD